MSVATHLNRPDIFGVEQSTSCGNATFIAYRASATRVVVTVSGEIDAANGRAFGRYVERHARGGRQLVVDLRGVAFCGTDGFRALYYVSVQCARSDVDWVIVGSRAARRLLAICDPDGDLPLVDEINCAQTRLDHLERCHSGNFLTN